MNSAAEYVSVKILLSDRVLRFSMKLRVGLVQFSRHTDRLKNLERMINIVSRIDGPDVVCLPEAWLGGDVIEEEKEAESLCNLFGKLTSERGFYLLLGGFLVRHGNRVYSTCYVINSKGEVEGFTDKRFPSLATGERAFCSSGKALPIFCIKRVKIGIVLCVDTLYPEVVRSLALRQAVVIFNPSNIPENRVEMWRHIATARAVENTVFYAFVNNTSTHYPDGRKVSGGSFIISPGGEVIIKAGKKETCLNAELDLSLIGKLQKRWPFVLDMRKRIHRMYVSDFTRK
jgi:predicted amidohydrolase